MNNNIKTDKRSDCVKWSLLDMMVKESSMRKTFEGRPVQAERSNVNIYGEEL